MQHTVPVRAKTDSRSHLEGATNTRQAVHLLTSPSPHSYTHLHAPTNSPPFPGLVQWTVTRSQCWSPEVGWTSARNKERKQKERRDSRCRCPDQVLCLHRSRSLVIQVHIHSIMGVVARCSPLRLRLIPTTLRLHCSCRMMTSSRHTAVSLTMRTVNLLNFWQIAV